MEPGVREVPSKAFQWALAEKVFHVCVTITRLFVGGCDDDGDGGGAPASVM
jgi:hypothetical protein